MLRSSQEEKNKSIALVASLLFMMATIIAAFILYNKVLVIPDTMPLREGHRDEDYCRMVKQYMETNGREGWRDYRNIYFKECIRQPGDRRG